jgi:hypothetical protein
MTANRAETELEAWPDHDLEALEDWNLAEIGAETPPERGGKVRLVSMADLDRRFKSSQVATANKAAIMSDFAQALLSWSSPAGIGGGGPFAYRALLAEVVALTRARRINLTRKQADDRADN